MKPLKLLACLVTLPFTCGLTLQAADPQDFRQWTDTSGRTITARLIEAPNKESVKIERQDGNIFTISLKTLSAEDQGYVTMYREENIVAAPSRDAAVASPAAAEGSPLNDPDSSIWVLLNAGGSQPASFYNTTPLDKVIEGLNRRLTDKAVKTATGLPLKLRTEPSDLAARIEISGGMQDMTVAAFVREIARINDLAVKTDAAGMVVLVDKTPPPSRAVASFFGVPIAPR